MKRIVLVFCALAFTGAISSAAFADCSQGHAAAKPVQTDSKGS
ncbi:Ig-like domain-containing protein [Ancylobacter novellus DSM 506]|uniref:Ig-like domain-containing protein n=1 Tax=Ancylobacter novellus (strain ATCC 8093 / DSM 506 / JCM 20403 / CCM 1077 / IAM 12100 / NBRC 12443 / NCIMB 10456) TaxID=639283 RepID=D7A8P5_ANCN5|nr:hypothetical protein [Ancylobacter novellus]ADH90579.1 Ig-like domain-containing protein [Ancylobacter novellus DSM 506]